MFCTICCLYRDIDSITLDCGHVVHRKCLHKKIKRCTICNKKIDYIDKYYTDYQKIILILNNTIRRKINMDVFHQIKLMSINKFYIVYFSNPSVLLSTLFNINQKFSPLIK